MVLEKMPWWAQSLEASERSSKLEEPHSAAAVLAQRPSCLAESLSSALTRERESLLLRLALVRNRQMGMMSLALKEPRKEMAQRTLSAPYPRKAVEEQWSRPVKSCWKLLVHSGRKASARALPTQRGS